MSRAPYAARGSDYLAGVCRGGYLARSAFVICRTTSDPDLTCRSTSLSLAARRSFCCCAIVGMSLERRDVRGLRALGARLGIEGDLRPLGQGAIALSGDGRVVHEEVLPTLVRRDEAEPLVIAEPLDGSGGHECSSVLVPRTRRSYEHDLRAPAL